MKIKWVDYGIASIITHNKIKTLEVNRNLKSYPELLKEIIKHEQKHLKSNSLIDFKLDFLSFFKLKHKTEFILFLINHPLKIIKDSFPIKINLNKKNKEIIIDYYSLIILILFLILLLIITTWILLK